MKAKHILITGASGTIGQEIIHQLVSNEAIKISVFDILSKKSASYYKKVENRVNLIAGDITRSEDVAKIPAGIDVVIHLAAVIPPLADERPDLTQKVNVVGTKLLLDHLQNTSPGCFFMFSSSVSVYGDRLRNPDIRVGDPLVPSAGDIYANSKIEAERLVEQSPLRSTIFRLTGIMKNHKISKLMFHMPLETTFEIATPEDTARAFVKAIESQDALTGRTFNLGGGASSTLSYREFLQRSFDIYGLGKLNFPEHAFAERNFHCGRMADGDELEDILHFRQDTIETYFTKTSKTVSGLMRFFTILLRPVIKWYLLQISEPFRAWKTKDSKQLNRFFYSSADGAGKVASGVSIVLVLMLAFLSQNLQAQSLSCNISNIRQAEGQLCIAVFENQQQFASEEPVYSMCVEKKKMKDGKMKVDLPLPDGSYGITVLDDTDRNGKMKYNLLSMPAEGFGFSNYIHKGFIKPLLKKFAVIFKKDEVTEVNVKMQYLPGSK